MRFSVTESEYDRTILAFTSTDAVWYGWVQKIENDSRKAPENGGGNSSLIPTAKNLKHKRILYTVNPGDYCQSQKLTSWVRSKTRLRSEGSNRLVVPIFSMCPRHVTMASNTSLMTHLLNTFVCVPTRILTHSRNLKWRHTTICRSDIEKIYFHAHTATIPLSRSQARRNGTDTTYYVLSANAIGAGNVEVD